MLFSIIGDQVRAVLVGDIGSTRMILQAYDLNKRIVLQEWKFQVRDKKSLIQTLKDCKEDCGYEIQAAYLGIPGPVVKHTAYFPNISHWKCVSEDEVTKESFIPNMNFRNDFMLTSYAIFSLKPQNILQLNKAPQQKNKIICVVGVTTGVGTAIMIPTQQTDGSFKHVSFLSQSGQVAFPYMSSPLLKEYYQYL